MYQDQNDSPLTPRESEKLFRALELVSLELQRLLNNGVLAMDESLDDERIASGQRKIDQWRQDIQKTQKDMQRLRAYVRHKRAAQSHKRRG